MEDNSFEPATCTTSIGQTVRFSFANVGKVDHEAILGDERLQTEHEQEVNPQTTGTEGAGGNGRTAGFDRSVVRH